MKPILYLLLVMTAIFTFPQHASAGFFVKRNTAATLAGAAAAKAEMTAQTAIAKHPSGLLSYYDKYKQNTWYGIASVIAGVLGLFIPGVNFLAILFGLLGMGRKAKQPGLSIAGFVIGVLELGLFLLTSSTLVALILF